MYLDVDISDHVLETSCPNQLTSCGASLNVSKFTQTTLKKVPSVNTNDTTPMMPVVRKKGDVVDVVLTTTPIAGFRATIRPPVL
jgi:hypothetical protein